MSDSLIQALPDLVAFVRRDGVITHHLGGRQLQGMPNLAEFVGRRIDEAWPGPMAQLLAQMLRRAFATRAQVEARFAEGARNYEVRVRPQGRDRVLCLIRESAETDGVAPARAGEPVPAAAGVERRGFLMRMKQSIAAAALREQPLSLCMIHLGGVAAIGQGIDFTVADQVITTALQRLPACPTEGPDGESGWYIGQLGEGLIAVVIHGAAGREAVRTTVQAICDSLAAPVAVGDASFCLEPRAGVAILGEDAVKPMALLEHARVALADARRAGPGALQFYSDTLRSMVAVRLDFERELRDAIAASEIELRYVGRHELSSGQLVAVQAYLRWQHPLRGEVSPSEFLPIAASTGLSVAVSRCVLARLQQDSGVLRRLLGDSVRLSFGPLRHHLVSDELRQDVEQLLQSSGLGAEMIEVRISEKTLASLGKVERMVGHLAGLGARVVLDEFGRGFSSLARIAQLPLHGLQIDRRFVLAATERPSASRFCQGAIALARSYGLMPIAPGIDTEAARQQLLALGCEQGLGDHFPPIRLASAEASADRAPPARRSAANS